MKRELHPELVSYKKRSVRVNGRWISVSEWFDLNTIRLKETATYELAQDFDGSYLIVSKEGANAN